MAKKTPTQSTKKVTGTKPKAPNTPAAEPRTLKTSTYNSFKLQKKITPAQLGSKLPSAFGVFKDSLRVLTGHPKLFLGVLFWYGLINIVFIQGLSAGGDITSTKTALDSVYQGGIGHLWSGLASFTYLLSTSTSSSSGSSTGLFQFIWVVIASLVLIWTLRQVHARQAVRIRDGYYQGVYPLIPVMLVVMVVGLECVPFIIGGSIFSAVINNGIATSSVQLLVWGIGFFALTAVSVYLICSSFFAVYIACLPDVGPMQALRSARQLVAARRWTALRKILFLPLVLGLLNVIVMLPVIMLVPVAATWVFVVVSTFNLAIAHSYYYSLYRSLL